VQIAQQAFLVSYLVAECALSLAAAGSILALAQAGGLIGRLFWGAMPAHRVSAFAALIVIGSGITLCAVLLGALGNKLPFAVLATLCFLFGATSAGWVGVHIAEVARLAPQDAVGPVTAAILVIGLPGLILGPLAFSALAAATSFGFGFCAFALLSLAGVAALATARQEAPAHT
jgi:hypothetical protein